MEEHGANHQADHDDHDWDYVVKLEAGPEENNQGKQATKTSHPQAAGSDPVKPPQTTNDPCVDAHQEETDYVKKKHHKGMSQDVGVPRSPQSRKRGKELTEREQQLMEAIEDRTNEKNQLASEKYQLEEELDKTKHDVFALRHQVNTLEAEKRAKESSGDRERKEVDHLKQRISELEHHLNILHEHSKKQSRTVFKLKEEAFGVEMQEEQIQSYEGLIQELEERQDSLQKDLSKSRSELETVTKYKEKMEKELITLKEEVFSAANENEELRAKVVQFSESLEAKNELLRDVYKLENEKAQLNDQLEAAQAQAARLREELERSRGTVLQYELQVQWYREQLQKRNEPTVGDELAPYRLHFQDPLPTNRQVGSGCYGTVYAIEIDGVQCIAKRVQDILLGERGEEAVGGDQRRAIEEKFHQECILLSKIRHPNIVQFMGVRYGRDMYDLTLVMERLPMDLQKCLERCHVDKFFIPLSIRFSILVDVTYGLLHLHNRSILHRDLTAGNILLTSNLRAKIADLGVSRIVESRHSQELSTLPGTIGYMPPEALLDEPEYNLKLDVFSFGVLALFVALQQFPEFSHQRAPDAIAVKGECELYKRRKWIAKIGERHFLYPLIHKCLQDNSTARPITMELNAMMKELSGQFPRRLKDIGAMLTQLNKLGMVTL